MSAIHAPTSAALKMANAPTTRRAGPGRRRSRRGPSAGGAGAAAPSSTGGRYRERRARRQGACTTDADTVTSQVGRRRRRPTFVIWATEWVGEVTKVGRRSGSRRASAGEATVLELGLDEVQLVDLDDRVGGAPVDVADQAGED